MKRTGSLRIIRPTRHAKKGGRGRMPSVVGNVPTIVGEAARGIDADDRALEQFHHLAMLKTNKWRSCPHCRLLGYLALFPAGTYKLTDHLRDHVLAVRLSLPPPIPDRAIAFRDRKKKAHL